MIEGKSILVVDDDLAIVEMYEMRLKAEGALVSVAHDGSEALEIIESAHPDIILLDLMMPEVTGFDVLLYLRDNPSLNKIPVIVLTALIENDKYQKAKELGAIDYLVKSENMPADVVERVKRVIAKIIDDSEAK